MMLKVGLTGGIGSGKSTVAKVFEVLGIPVYYADDAAKRLMNEDEALKESLVHEFGENTYLNGALNRPFLSAVVFNDPHKLQSLNALVHPATLRNAAKWMKEQKAPFVIKEAALIFESGSQENLDYVIGVSAPKHLRIQRVMHRDHITRDDVIARMDKQIDEEIKMKLCNFVILNDEAHSVITQVLELYKDLLKLSANR